MRAADLPEEFQEPVGYAGHWLWLALLALALVVVYYAAVLWWSRRRREPAAPPPERLDVGSEQSRHLARLDELADEVHAGAVSAREGHQRVSDLLRSYVDAVTPLPARTMALEDLRRAAPRDLTAAVELMYPPEFAPGEEGRAAETFDEAHGRARALVSRWGAPGPGTAIGPVPPPPPPVSSGRPGGGPWT